MEQILKNSSDFLLKHEDLDTRKYKKIFLNIRHSDENCFFFLKIVFFSYSFRSNHSYTNTLNATLKQFPKKVKPLVFLKHDLFSDIFDGKIYRLYENTISSTTGA